MVLTLWSGGGGWRLVGWLASVRVGKALFVSFPISNFLLLLCLIFPKFWIFFQSEVCEWRKRGNVTSHVWHKAVYPVTGVAAQHRTTLPALQTTSDLLICRLQICQLNYVTVYEVFKTMHWYFNSSLTMLQKYS